MDLRDESLEALEERLQRATVPAWDEVEGDPVGRIVLMASSASPMMRMLGRMTFDRLHRGGVASVPRS